ncbi:MAG: HAD-IB family hydrolase [Muribaculaceae bacterium]|nr:HAD-IB family hydrolase [Muribaculaceae bacterium]MDE6559630.1 HAD-IB family hydrolase [Muribaculaceae bacterium]
MSGKIKAYDFDGTLIAGDSFILFPIHALSPVRLVCAILKSIPTLIKWKLLGLIDASIAKEKIFFNLYHGLPFDRMRQKAESFINILDRRIITSVIDTLPPADTADTSVIVSASPSFWILPWAKHHGFDDVIATEAEIKDGILTGRFSTPNCKGEEKVRRLQMRFPDLESRSIEAWGDSIDDIPMLGLAETPHFVLKANQQG